MSIFSRKQSVDLEDFCRDFYEKNILNPVIEGIDAGAVFVDTIKRNIVEVDNNFTKINSQKFADEMVLLRFELFALAWLHQFGDKLAIAQSTFTKNYLGEKKRSNIWEDSEDYNQAIARSSTAGKSEQKAFDRVYLARAYKTRADLFNQFHKEGFDPKCVARALNRLFSDEAWKKDITANFLVFTLCDRLGFKQNEPNKEAQFRLAAIIHGFYDGAKQALERVRVKQK